VNDDLRMTEMTNAPGVHFRHPERSEGSRKASSITSIDCLIHDLMCDPSPATAEPG